MIQCNFCDKFKPEKDFNPMSQGIFNKSRIKLNLNICKACDKILKKESIKWLEDNEPKLYEKYKKVQGRR
jgi:hypothetical protein